MFYAMWRWLPRAVLLFLLLSWPLTYRYTSFGIDHDAVEGPHVATTFYRLRWPGNGVTMIGYLIEHHPAHGQPLQPFDLGGRFFHPAHAAPPVTFANRLGFWWVNINQARGDSESPVAPHGQRAVFVGFPHWLMVTVAVVGCLWTFRAARKTQLLRQRSNVTPLD